MIMKRLGKPFLMALLVVSIAASSTFAAQMPQSKTKTEIDKKQESIKEKKTFVLDNFKMIASALKALGVECDELSTYIKEGKNLEDVLREEKISVRKFKKELLKAYQAEVEEAVKAGKLTSQQGKQLNAAIKETVKSWQVKK